ncbi:hypothetical protein LXH13_30345 [Streptomyces spinosirectus]|jgi:hypothetical protein|uniref:hypothetical protein n=1 Tax=Streptomyces TaxID=1883 RepID=UPI000D39D2A2|nr:MULTISPECIES: hypothetical protein [Streptomyces]MBY8338985.1 hypothetical protein [Streptomyces plumbidurans]PTN00253.1 hypothetical protein C7821_101529 [Streptomyces sp. VMFN-G11Ma]UIR21083.1 hypothetical protein LXH13_30345 [Streptomyces spinosirectus]
MPRPRFTLPLGSPLQLLLLACSFALSAYAGVRLLDGDWFEIALWFVGAALIHDLLLLPLYATADRLLVRATGPRRTWVAYVRVPTTLSLLLLLVWFPLITGQVTRRYDAVTGLSADRFLEHWLLVTAVLFAGSAGLFVVRLRRKSAAPHGR